MDWVNVPSLSAGTTIYACYGQYSVTTDQSHPMTTWSSTVAGVWRFSERDDAVAEQIPRRTPITG